MTSLQIAKNKIKDLETVLQNERNKNKIKEEQYEAKIDALEKKVDSLMATVSNLNAQVTKLTEENTALKIRIKELEAENDILKGKAIKIDSTTSNKPASTDEVHKVQNHRKITDRKQGGQPGRDGKTLTEDDIKELISSGKARVVEEHYGDIKNKKTNVKYIVDVKTEVIVRKIIIHGNIDAENYETNLPEECKANNSKVVYSNNLKALVAVMYAQEVIAFDRMSEFLAILTDNILNVSHGTLNNWVSVISRKCKKVKKKLIRAIKKSKVIYTDLTTTSVKGKYGYVRNYSNDNLAILIACASKKITEVKKHNILTNFFGYIMHDHDTGLYNFGIKSKHVECWIHLGRELKYIMENLPENDWAKELWEYALQIKDKKEELIKNNITEFTSEKIIEYETKYDEIVKKGLSQNETVKSNYLKKKERPILNRLIKYKQNYLNFAYDLVAPFDDNPSERDLRPTKNKKKISGCHRSYDGLIDYCNIRTIISTCIKQKLSYFECFKHILNNKVVCVKQDGLLVMP